MINIAICDDNKFICSELEDILLLYEKQNCLEFNVDVFFSGDYFYNHLSKNNKKYDVLFLDIEIGILNGVEIGRKIRDEMKNENTKIIFISAHEDYVMELFKIRPFHFLLKPLNKDDLIETLNKMFELMKIENTDNFYYKLKHDNRKENLDNIIYFESLERKIKMVTFDNTEIFYGKLKDIYEELHTKNFFMPHKSYLVNYKYVKVFEYSQLVLVNDDVIPIGKTKRKFVRDLQISFERE